MIVKTLLVHVIALYIRSCPRTLACPHFCVPPYICALPFAHVISAPNAVLYYDTGIIVRSGRSFFLKKKERIENRQERSLSLLDSVNVRFSDAYIFVSD